MKILYCHDNIYVHAPDGGYFSAGQFSYNYWAPYLRAFKSLTVLGRGEKTHNMSEINHLQRSDGKNVQIVTFDNSNSLTGLLFQRRRLAERIEEIVSDANGVIIRAMSEIGWLAYKAARKKGLPIAHELSGCPWDNTWNYGGLAAKLYAPVRYMRARIVARNADAVLYVTREFLPRRYPAKGLTAIASNVRLQTPPASVLKARRKRIKDIFGANSSSPITFGLIGQIHHRLKGIDVALKALGAFKRAYPDIKFKFRILGPGNSEIYQYLIDEQDLTGQVIFDGVLSAGTQVLEWLDAIDIYLQPSLHEGLPRALIEAISRGCPALASTAGGIPELLDSAYLHKPGDHVKLSEKIYALLQKSELEIDQIAGENFQTSLSYTSDKLEPLRDQFWQQFADIVREKG